MIGLDWYDRRIVGSGLSAEDVAGSALRDAEAQHRRAQVVLVSQDLQQRRALKVVQIHVQGTLLEKAEVVALWRFWRRNAGF